jgi:hypothetical protein
MHALDERRFLRCAFFPPSSGVSTARFGAGRLATDDYAQPTTNDQQPTTSCAKIGGRRKP